MSTNSCFAEGQGSTLRGRYCHSDGYPTHQGRALWTIVQRDGVEKARQTLLHDHRGWSFIDPTREDWDGLMSGRGDIDLIPGYGMAYKNEEEAWADPLYYEWAYVLHDDALWVLHDGAPVSLPIPWDDPEPDWDAIEKKGWPE